MKLSRTLLALAAALALVGCNGKQPTEAVQDVETLAPKLDTLTERPSARSNDVTAFMDMLKGAESNSSGIRMAPPSRVYVGERNEWAKKFQGRWKRTRTEFAGVAWFDRPNSVLDIHPVGTEDPDDNSTNQAFPTLNHRKEDSPLNRAIAWYMLWNIDEERKVLVLLTRYLAAQNFFDGSHGDEQVWQLHEVGYTEVVTERRVNGRLEEKRELVLRTHTAWSEADVTVWEYVGDVPTE